MNMPADTAFASHFHLARLSLECRTPLSIGTGQRDGIFDMQLATDANGLPAIPGTALAGVLRHLYRSTGRRDVDDLFGHADEQSAQASRLQVSWGWICDSHGRPVDRLLLDRTVIDQDPLLQHAAGLANAPQIRDRVRIGHRGVAADTAKFDRSVLPAGYRFVVELSLWGNGDDQQAWHELLALCNSPGFRLGGATRAGLGAIGLVAVDAAEFDLRDPQDAEAFRHLWRHQAPERHLQRIPADPGLATRQFVVRITPNGYWRIGRGSHSLQQDPNQKQADMLPRSERRVCWQDGRGQLEPQPALLIPASSIKGALAHRIAYHYNCLIGCFADEMSKDELQAWDKSSHCKAVMALFGEASREGQNDRQGRAGVLLIDDVYLPSRDYQGKLQGIMHNAIDRFTGGVRNGALYEEEMVWRTPVQFTIRVLDDRPLQDDPRIREALARSLNDLCEGRLALGAGSSKGHGYFHGEHEEQVA